MINEKTERAEVKARLKEQKERLKKIVFDAKRAFPKEREKASTELALHISELKQALNRIEEYQCKFFIDDKNTITSIGLVGRAVDVDFAIIELKTCIAFLERVKESLDFVVCDEGDNEID